MMIIYHTKPYDFIEPKVPKEKAPEPAKRGIICVCNFEYLNVIYMFSFSKFCSETTFIFYSLSVEVPKEKTKLVSKEKGTHLVYDLILLIYQHRSKC